MLRPGSRTLSSPLLSAFFFLLHTITVNCTVVKAKLPSDICVCTLEGGIVDGTCSCRRSRRLCGGRVYRGYRSQASWVPLTSTVLEWRSEIGCVWGFRLLAIQLFAQNNCRRNFFFFFCKAAAAGESSETCTFKKKNVQRVSVRIWRTTSAKTASPIAAPLLFPTPTKRKNKNKKKKDALSISCMTKLFVGTKKRGWQRGLQRTPHLRVKVRMAILGVWCMVGGAE